MKILHLSDLHLGKNIYGISLTDSGDQQALTDNIVKAVEENNPDAVVIAGDIYDRSNPPEGAVELFERLLKRLMETQSAVFIIGGNHDSVKRLSYLNDTLKNYNIHIADELSPELENITLTDEYGDVTFWMMPYAYPALISQVLDDPDIKYKDYDYAVRTLLKNQNIDSSVRNVLIAHQNVIQNGEETKRGGSETSVGGVGGIESDAFSDFEYTALGHIHAAYHLGEGNVRYCGTPMSYHFDETRQKEKGALLIEIGEKGGDISVEKITFEPLHPMIVIKGTYEDAKSEIGSLKGNEYLKVTLTDMRSDYKVYGNLYALAEAKGVKLLEVDSTYKTKGGSADSDTPNHTEKSVDAVFDEFYSRNNERLDEKDMGIVAYLANMLELGEFDEEDGITRAAEQLLNYIGEGK